MDNPGVIYTHQAPVFREIFATASAFAQENWYSLSHSEVAHPVDRTKRSRKISSREGNWKGT